MLKKIMNKRKIKKYKEQIEELETRLSRSQSEYIQALLEGRKPEAADMEFHQKYMEEIRTLRQKIRELQRDD